VLRRSELEYENRDEHREDTVGEGAQSLWRRSVEKDHAGLLIDARAMDSAMEMPPSSVGLVVR